MRAARLCLLALAMSNTLVRPAAAQEPRIRISGVTSAAVGDGGPAPSVSAAGGFQIAPHAGFEIEALYISGQDFGNQVGVVIQNGFSVASQFQSAALNSAVNSAQFTIIPTPRISIKGRSVAFLSSFVGDLRVGRLRPYVQLGGGMANVARRVTVTYGPQPVPLSASTLVTIPPVRYTLSENDLAMTAGTGLDVQLWRGLWVAADVRYMHLFGGASGVAEDLNVTRVGARTSWVF